jgi:hypothetical protein
MGNIAFGIYNVIVLKRNAPPTCWFLLFIALETLAFKNLQQALRQLGNK